MHAANLIFALKGQSTSFARINSSRLDLNRKFDQLLPLSPLKLTEEVRMYTH